MAAHPMTSQSGDSPKSLRRRALEAGWRLMPARVSMLKALAALPAALKGERLLRIAHVGMDLTPESTQAVFATNFGADAPRVRVPGSVGRNYLFLRAAEAMHEQPAIELCAKLLPDCGAFVDVGAHLGLFMWPLAKYLRADRPGYFFEPNPELHALLANNVARLGLPYRGYCAAIAAEDGVVDFHVDRDDWSMSTLVDGFAPGHRHERVRVDAMRFDTFASSVDLRDALVKADIECAEGIVVDGIAAAKGRVRYLVCEVLEQAFRDGFVADVERRLGARALAITAGGLLPASRIDAYRHELRNWLFAIAPGDAFAAVANGASLRH